jgi:methylated-DNA-[protein]-cysteine S-methyltransferase
MMMSRAFDRALRALAKAKAPKAFAAAVLERAGASDSYVTMLTPIGEVYVAYGRRGVVAVRRAKDDRAYEAWHRRTFGRPVVRDRRPDPGLLVRLRRRVDGDGRASVLIDLRDRTAFQRAVLEKAREIPRGQVRPYAWVAREIGRPQAVRAVGSALGRNPVPLLIPCHRVVRSDGEIGSYIFGNPAKRSLLAIEGARLSA